LIRGENHDDIASITYANLAGGGKARLEIWAKDTIQGKDPVKKDKDPKYKPKK